MKDIGIIPLALRSADLAWGLDRKETFFSESLNESLHGLVLGLVEEWGKEVLKRKKCNRSSCFGNFKSSMNVKIM